jgi:hypothetical protein
MSQSVAEAQDYLNTFHSQLITKLQDTDTDPDSAVVEVAHSSGLHEYIFNLENNIRDLSKRVEEASLKPLRAAQAVDGDPETGKTAFEQAAPVLRDNAKASVRRSIGILIAEVGLVAIALWIVFVLFRGPTTASPQLSFGQAPLPDYKMRTYVLFATALMIVASISGIVYVV